MKILFMGTPDIAVCSLRALLEAGETVVGVVTREDKPQGRKMVLTPPPVKVLACEHGLPVYQPKTLRDDGVYEQLAALKPDLIVVVAYGRILPKRMLELAPYGAINVHVSLLPKYRGAAPMQRAIMNGETETGVTIMYMDEGLDTGDMISSEAFAILPDDDLETVHDHAAAVGARLLVEAVKQLKATGELPRRPQEHAQATYADKIEKEDCHIDFSAPASTVYARMRGVTPIPMPYAMHRGAMLKVCRAALSEGHGAVGEVIDLCADGDGYITVACAEGAIRLLSVTPAGKGRMSAGDFIRGRNIEKGDILS
ncbi:MAG: methionyl-tRNA formyltransferase [Clostridia bacterium]|nr:methionyl-tRNA formyltransferase [Clostridia bacterium]